MRKLTSLAPAGEVYGIDYSKKNIKIFQKNQ